MFCCEHVLEIQPPATLSYPVGPEACAGAVRGSCVERGAKEGDVILDVFVVEAGEVGEAAEGAYAGEDGVGLEVGALDLWEARWVVLLRRVMERKRSQCLGNELGKGIYLRATVTRDAHGVVP